jgi:hypothetical protein
LALAGAFQRLISAAFQGWLRRSRHDRGQSRCASRMPSHLARSIASDPTRRNPPVLLMSRVTDGSLQREADN